MNITLDQMDVNERGRVTGYRPMERAYRQKLLTMGLTKGAEFSITRRAPLGDPVEIVVKDYHLTLRQEEARSVIVERL